jgi:hypothetical protein
MKAVQCHLYGRASSGTQVEANLAVVDCNPLERPALDMGWWAR